MFKIYKETKTLLNKEEMEDLLLSGDLEFSQKQIDKLLHDLKDLPENSLLTVGKNTQIDILNKNQMQQLLNGTALKNYNNFKENDLKILNSWLENEIGENKDLSFTTNHLDTFFDFVAKDILKKEKIKA